MKAKMKTIIAASLCALFAHAAKAAPEQAVSDPAAEAVVQRACASDKPLVVFDTFYIMQPKNGDKTRPNSPGLDFNGDLGPDFGNLDGDHGDLVATVAGFSGKRVIPYQVVSVYPNSLAAGLQNLADDLEKGAIEPPAAIIASIIVPVDIDVLNEKLPSGQKLTMDNIAQHKGRALEVLLSYDHGNDGFLHNLDRAMRRIAARNIPVFVAAGNTGSDPLFNMLALFSGTYAVGAVDPDGGKTAFTSDSSLVSVWRNGRFMFKTVPGGVDINNDGKPDFTDAQLSHGEPIAVHYNGRPVAQAVQAVPDWTRSIGGGQERKIQFMNKMLPEGVYPIRDLMLAYGYADGSGNMIQSLKQGAFMHHPSLTIFKEDAQHNLIFDPEGSGDRRQVAVYNATSFATPNICAPK